MDAHFGWISHRLQKLQVCELIHQLDDMLEGDLSREAIAQRLTILIRMEGVSLAAFAEAAGVNRSTLSSAVHSKKQTLTYRDAWKIAKKYHVTTDFIFGGEMSGLNRPTRDRISQLISDDESNLSIE